MPIMIPKSDTTTPKGRAGGTDLSFFTWRKKTSFELLLEWKVLRRLADSPKDIRDKTKSVAVKMSPSARRIGKKRRKRNNPGRLSEL